ncbi:MAG: vWA domain-containing protein [Myxococcota bacterium]
MKRWQLTVFLGGLAVVTAFVAPLLTGFAEGDVAPVVKGGELRLDAGLDQESVLVGEPRERYVVVDVGARLTEPSARRSRDVVVLLDASGSMSVGSKMDHARRAVRALRDELRADEDFAVVAFNDAATTVVPPGASSAELDMLLEGILDYGGTNLYEGLTLASEHLETMRRPGERGHLVVVSDGVANVGIVDEAAFEAIAQRLASDGVEVSAIGIGSDVDPASLDRLTGASGGTSTVLADAADLVHELPAAHRGDGGVVARDLSLAILPSRGVEEVRWLEPVGSRTLSLTEHESFTAVASVRLDAPVGPDAFTVELRYTDPNGIARRQTAAVRYHGTRMVWEVASSLHQWRKATAMVFSVSDRLTTAEASGTPVTGLDLASELRDTARRFDLPELNHDADRLLDTVGPAAAKEMAPAAEELVRDHVQ